MPAPPPRIASVGPAIYSTSTPAPSALALTVDDLPPDLQVGDQLVAVCCFWDWTGSNPYQTPTFTVTQPVISIPVPWIHGGPNTWHRETGTPDRYVGMCGFQARYDEAFIPTTFNCAATGGAWLPGGGWRIQTYAIRYATLNGFSSVFGQPQGGAPGSTSAGGSPGTNQYGWPGGTGGDYTLAVSMAFSDQGDVSVPGVNNTYETIATQAPISGRGGGWGIAAVGKWYSGTVDGTGWTKDSAALTAVSILGRGGPAPAKTYTITPVGTLKPTVSVGMLEACNTGVAAAPPYTVDVPDVGLSKWWEVINAGNPTAPVGTSSGTLASNSTTVLPGDVVLCITQTYGTNAVPGPQSLARLNLTGSIGGAPWTLLTSADMHNTSANISAYKEHVRVWACAVTSSTTIGSQTWASVDSGGAPMNLPTYTGKASFYRFRPVNGATWSVGWGPILWSNGWPTTPNPSPKETVTTSNGLPVEAVFWGWLPNSSGGGAFQEGGWDQVTVNSGSGSLGAGGVSRRMVIPGRTTDTPLITTVQPVIMFGIGLDVEGYTF